MNKKLLLLAQRREQLTADVAAQRAALVQVVNAWHKPLIIADNILGAIAYVKQHPLWLVGGTAALLTILRPRRIGMLLKRGWITWPITRLARILIDNFLNK